MRIVIRHNEAGQWWWAAVGESGQTAAVSTFYASRTDCMRGVAELKVEGPAAPIAYEQSNAARPETSTVASFDPVRVAEDSRTGANGSAPIG